MPNTYFRITAYHPTLDVSFIIDSINQHNEIWEFSAALVKRKCKILQVSDSSQFLDGNIPKTTSSGGRYIIRACTKGYANIVDGIVNIKGRFYTPNTGM